MSLIARTLAPGYLYRFNKNGSGVRIYFEPQIRNMPNRRILMFLWQKGADCKGAFDLMGWEKTCL
jgi:hypothetical protein